MARFARMRTGALLWRESWASSHLIAVAGFLFVRMEPPTVIRVGSDGQASLLSPNHDASRPLLFRPFCRLTPEIPVPDEYEKQAFVKTS